MSRSTAADIYSLGCVLYEMVAGRPPFLGDSPVAVASKHVLEQPTVPSKMNRDVSPDLDAVILRAMAKNSANRYQSAEEFAPTWSAFVAGCRSRPRRCSRPRRGDAGDDACRRRRAGHAARRARGLALVDPSS